MPRPWVSVVCALLALGGPAASAFEVPGTIKSVDADNNTTLNYYDKVGNLTETVDADGDTVLNYYDKDNLLTASVNADGILTLKGSMTMIN